MSFGFIGDFWIMNSTIVISTYNGEKYIEEQLSSILNQSLQPDEVIIRDDCSSDKTVEICNRFIKDNSLQQSWKIYVNKKNIGWAENFYRGFDQATGDIIFPCDQDDIWMKEKIKCMTDIMKHYNDIGLLIGGNIKMIDKDGDIEIIKKKYSGKLNRLKFDRKLLFVDHPGCVYCLKKSFYEEIKEYRFSGYPHDSLLIRMGRLLGKAYYYDTPVIYWRRHSQNTTGKPIRNNKDMQDQLVYYIKCLELLLNYCKDNDGFSREEKLIKENISFYNVRLEAFARRKIVGKNSLFSCIKYLGFYPRVISILGDFIRLIH